MLEKTQKFVSDHKSHIATAAVAAGIGGVLTFVYMHKQTYLNLPDNVLAQLAAAPEKAWVGYTIKGVELAMTALNENAV